MMLRVLVVLGVLAGVVWADPQPQAKMQRKGLMPPPPPQAMVLDKMRQMTPEEREQVLKNMPPARRQMFERRLEQWNRLEPGQKQRLQGSLESFRNLTPEQQQTVRGLYRKFSETMPEEKRGEGSGTHAGVRAQGGH